jgi:hypothetical protein
MSPPVSLQTSPVRRDPDPVDTSTAAAAAEAARLAQQPLDPRTRALEGFRIAAGRQQPGAGPAAAAVADARSSALSALERTDLTPERRAQVQNVVERLGNAVIDGRIEPHINDVFRQHLYDLATAPDGVGPAGEKFNGALAQLTRAAQVLDQVPLRPGTMLGYDVGANQPTGRSGLPVLDVDRIDADLYLHRGDNVLEIQSAKWTPNALGNELREQARSPALQQIGRQTQWLSEGTPEAPRAMSFFVLDGQADFTGMMNPANLDPLERAVGNADTRAVVIGDRSYSVNELRAMGNAAGTAAKPAVDAQRAAWVEAGNPAKTFDVGKAYTEYFRAHMANPEQTMRTLGTVYGQQQPLLERLPQPELPTARQGGLFGAGAGGALTLIRVGSDGNLSLQDLKDVGTHALIGGGVGALQAQGERLLVPAVDRAIGATVQRGATTVATETLGQSTAAATGSGVFARTLATRVVGSTAIGTAITTGMSVYENREGLARGDSQAIGNVAADTAVGATSIAASVAVGAAVGSVVPVAGTAVGAVVGLAVGVGITYGAQISGARDAIANTVSGWADGIKSWF